MILYLIHFLFKNMIVIFILKFTRLFKQLNISITTSIKVMTWLQQTLEQNEIKQYLDAH